MEELDKANVVAIETAYWHIIDMLPEILNQLSDAELKEWWLSPESTNRDRWEALERFADIGEHRLRERCRAIGFAQ